MRCRNKHIALFLLSVYLPMLMLASLHIHTGQCGHGCVGHEQHQKQSFELDGGNCLLCQFLQLTYEEAPQVTLEVSQSVSIVEVELTEQTAFSAIKLNYLSRAPPVLL